MSVETLGPEKIDEGIDTKPPKMSHVLSFTPGRCLCGKVDENAESRTVVKCNPVDCVVCMSLWYGMPFDQKLALLSFWGVL